MKDGLLQQKYEGPTFKQNPDAEHHSLRTEEMACTQMEEMIKSEVLHRVDEVIHERLAEMMTSIIFRVLRESFQDQ